MHDRSLHFSYTGALATIAGFIALVLIVLTFICQNYALGFLSMHFAVGSALFRVRSWFCAMGEREMEAFNLGRQSGPELRRVP